jgi:hypothetical protein
MIAHQKRLFYLFITAGCWNFSGCVTAPIHSDWRELRAALPVQCEQVLIPGEAISAEHFVFGMRFHYLAMRLRNGSRRILVVNNNDATETPNFEDATKIAVDDGNEIVAFLQDEAAVVTIGRNEAKTEFRLIAAGRGNEVISSLQLGYGELVTIAATSKHITALYREYLEAGDRYVLTNIRQRGNSMEWQTDETVMPVSSVIPIRFKSNRLLGFAGMDVNQNPGIWLYEMDSGQLLGYAVEPRDAAQIMADGTSDMFATESGRKLTIGSMQPSDSFDGGIYRIAELISKPGSQIYRLSKDYGTLLQDVESASAAILVSEDGLQLAMGNWLDAERTVGTYTPSTEGLFLAGNRQVFGVFPENSHFGEFEFTEANVLSWTVRNKLNHGWKFDRCRVEN